MIHRLMILGSTAALMLVGCAASPSPTPEPEAVHIPLPLPEGLIGDGDLAAPGGIVGSVEIFREDGSTRIEVTGVEVDPNGEAGNHLLALSDSPIQPGVCGNANVWQIGVTAGPDGTFNIPSAPWDDDPTFLTSVVIVRQLLEPPADGSCAQPIIAIAPLSWDVPLTRPWVDPVDGGAGTGAEGETSVTAGRLLYTTASGDSWDEIAARFGVSSDDLEWLNPIRTPGEAGTAFADQILNLDPSDRSDSESRRPN